VRLDKLRIQLQCLPRCGEHLRANLVRRFAVENRPQFKMGARQARVCRSKCRVSIKCGLELAKGFLKPGPGALVELKAAFQVILLNLGRYRTDCD
jgi:hypothetical protein